MEQKPHRREVLVSAAAAMTAAAVIVNTNPAQSASGGKPMSYQTKPMPFDPNAIKGMSAKLLTSHYDNNYTGAVKRLNAIADQLHTLDWSTAPGFAVNGLKREELMAMNSMTLHELFFDGLGAGGDPGGALAQAIERDFGTIDRWRKEFAAMGKALGGGSGWVLLCYMPRDKRLVNAWAMDHTTTPANGRPLLALDMYEHAYHMDYGAKAGAYVDAFMGAINWSNVAKLHAQTVAG